MTIIAADDQVASDAEIARALQEQFRQEEEQAAAAARSTREATAPPQSERSSGDAAVAQRLVDDELRAASAFETSVYSGGGGEFGGNNDDDAEVARRLDQEARDAAFAATLAQQDVAYASSRDVAGTIIAHDAATQRRIRRKRSLNSCIACIGAVAIAFMIFWFLRRNNVIVGGGGGGNPFDDLADWFGGGGWEGDYKSSGENVPWASSRNSRNGLELRVLNNLDEKWQDIFFAVMDEWDNGEPDTVSFEIERISDPSCRMVPGAMVVCNGNYGRTSWRGINELLTNNGYIISSVAKLNDYFLEGRSDDLRQYVCCHEIGHGLGLGHTDEGVYNPDLGECMDYTVNPGVNKHPGRTNFEALEQMYGRVNDRSRHIRGLLEDHQSGLDWRRMDSIVENSSNNNIEWRMLQRTERSEHYEADLGDGQRLLRVLLLA